MWRPIRLNCNHAKIWLCYYCWIWKGGRGQIISVSVTQGPHAIIRTEWELLHAVQPPHCQSYFYVSREHNPSIYSLFNNYFQLCANGEPICWSSSSSSFFIAVVVIFVSSWLKFIGRFSTAAGVWSKYLYPFCRIFCFYLVWCGFCWWLAKLTGFPLRQDIYVWFWRLCMCACCRQQQKIK